MAYTAHQDVAQARSGAEAHGAYWAYQMLHLALSVAPIIAGLDKYFHMLTEWDKYLAPAFPGMLGIGKEAFMHGVGVVEIIIGLVVAFKPKLGGYLLAAWLCGIIINLFFNPSMYSADPAARMGDIVLRDVGLLCGALALAWLARDYHAQTERNG